MKVTYSDFNLKQLELINAGVEFKASWTEFNETDALDYITHHSQKNYNFNNCQPDYLSNQLCDHVRSMNKHTDDVIIGIKKIHIDQYGEEGEEQMVLKIDYEFSGSGEDAAKATTGKVLMEEEYYESAKKVKKIIIDLKRNLYDFLIMGERFPIEEASASLNGNVLSIGA